ncbi:MAG TPA: hypothetical protein VGW33_12975 [Terriglobia bacterium]|nr:hypothetical protein [Terriglobia bacterium]
MVETLEAGDGFLRVVVKEAPDPSDRYSYDWAQYSFSQSFDPLGVAFSDHYWEDHRRLSAAGKIKHTVENCPERVKPITVREWSPQAGWTDVELPPVAAAGGTAPLSKP